MAHAHMAERIEYALVSENAVGAGNFEAKVVETARQGASSLLQAAALRPPFGAL
jgi:hypothetical protein